MQETRRSGPSLHSGVISTGVHDVVGQVDEKLSEASLCCGIVAEDGGEGGIAKGFGEALPQSLSGPSVVAKSALAVRDRMRRKDIPQEHMTYRRKHRTTCLRRRAVWDSTSWATILLRTVPTA